MLITVYKTEALHIQKTINLTLNTKTTSNLTQNVLGYILGFFEAFKATEPSMSGQNS